MFVDSINPSYPRYSQEMINLKESVHPNQLCEGNSLPFAPMLEYVKGIGFDEEPSYDKIKFMF